MSTVFTIYTIERNRLDWILSVIRYFSLLFLCNFRSLFYLLSKEKYVNKYSIYLILRFKAFKRKVTFQRKEQNERFLIFVIFFNDHIIFAILWTCDYVIRVGLAGGNIPHNIGILNKCIWGVCGLYWSVLVCTVSNDAILDLVKYPETVLTFMGS